ncbi:protein phosphatase 1, regulatory subunit 3Db [Chanos chanos]|uniref:Protein phosphatase 1, regulatory subunit 3Db n=1 Tax=Chanos chanos TaxID=29144 RepID=A0A6J2VSI6_CHACN|nr:protein phosphatase 1 regulatory subunit 3D-like [Chanos chanos]
MAKAEEQVYPGKTKSTIQFISGRSEVSRPSMTIRVRDIYSPKPQPERKPVPIRPPSPKPAPPRRPELHKSLSCEPEPKPIMRRRARSLPSAGDQKTSRHMQVRFVDSLGLELEDVKFFKAGEEPRIPAHVITRLLISSELAFGKNLELSLPYFKPCFPENMSTQPDFLKRLSHQKVCLEQILCSELGIIGTAQVLNLAFEKEVIARYSFTDWKSYGDSKASWVTTVHRDGDIVPESDVFRFRLPVPPFILKPGAHLEFALCFWSRGKDYWDNNQGLNYKLECHNYKLIVPKECEDTMVHFT